MRPQASTFDRGLILFTSALSGRVAGDVISCPSLWRTSLSLSANPPRLVHLRQRFVYRSHAKWRVPKTMIGRRLSQEEAKSCWRSSTAKQHVTDFDRVIDQPADFKSSTDTAVIASSHRTATATMNSIHSL